MKKNYIQGTGVRETWKRSRKGGKEAGAEEWKKAQVRSEEKKEKLE